MLHLINGQCIKEVFGWNLFLPTSPFLTDGARRWGRDPFLAAVPLNLNKIILPPLRTSLLTRVCSEGWGSLGHYPQPLPPLPWPQARCVTEGFDPFLVWRVFGPQKHFPQWGWGLLGFCWKFFPTWWGWRLCGFSRISSRFHVGRKTLITN